MRPLSFLLNYLALFSSLGTLLCCALPSFLVLLGLASTLSLLLSSAPWLVTLSQHKQWLFLIAGLLISSNFFIVYRLAPRLRSGVAACPPDAPQTCISISRFSRLILWLSATLYGLGFSAAYLLGPLLTALAS